MSTPSWAAIASPTTGPKPVTRLKTPGGQPELVDDLGEDEGAQRRHLARLRDHRAARGERRSDLGAELVQRVVPGRDRADHADRLADDQRVPDLLLPVDLARRPGPCRRSPSPAARPGSSRDCAERHPDLGRDQRRQLVARGAASAAEIAAQRVQPAARAAPPTRPRTRPRAAFDGPVDVLGGALGNPTDHLLGGRVDHLDRAGAGGLDPLAADVELVALDRLGGMLRAAGACGCLSCQRGPPDRADLRRRLAARLPRHPRRSRRRCGGPGP